jgi:membrane protein implicated in regulation of membrane protease activity
MSVDDVLKLGPWGWFIAGLILMGLEVLAPGAFMLWLGLAAIATGFVSLAVILSWQGSVVVFAVLSIVSVLIGRRMLMDRSRPKGESALNDRVAKLVGRTFVLDQPIEQGRGRVKVDDTVWRIEGPDLPPGSMVRVTGVDGTLLKVARA